MSTKKRRFFSGNTVEQALVQAASYFKIAPDQIAYREMEKRHGFVRTRRRVVIQVDPENLQTAPAPSTSSSPAVAAPTSRPTQAPPPSSPPASSAPSPPAPSTPPAPTPAPSTLSPFLEEEAGNAGAQAEPAPDPAPSQPFGRPDEGRENAEDDDDWSAAEEEQDDDDEQDEDDEKDEDDEQEESKAHAKSGPDAPMEVLAGAKEAAERILDLAGLDLSAEVEQGSDRLVVNLSGADRDRLLEEDAEVLLAIEQLLPRVMRGLVGDAPPIQVDSENFRQKQEDALQTLAREAVVLLRQGARAVELDTMAPGERRLVHMAVADEAGVRTDSEGEGFYKRVIIRRLDD